MPLYEYKCQKCEERLEVIRKVSDKPYTICPHCGGELKKLFSAPAIQFKGSGFYITDYARAGSAKPEGKEKGTSEGDSTMKTEAGGKNSGSADKT